MRLNEFVIGYLTCALWSSTDDTDTPFDENWDIDEFAAEALTQAIDECKQFQEDNAADLEATGADDSRNGHDFWLTRNHHGAGFWDRGYGEVGRRLTDAAHVWGECNPYVGDDGKLYLS